MEEEPAAKKQRTERWSSTKYYNPSVPSYIPPEIFLVTSKGMTALEAFEIRAALEDARRLMENNLSNQFFLRGDGEVLKVEAKFDKNGNRSNTLEALLRERHMKLLKDLSDRLKRYHSAAAASTNKEIIRKVRLSEEHMESKAYGAIIGARGKTHQDLEKETGCKIVLGGRGITDLKKKVNMKSEDALAVADEPPHVKITAPNEAALQKCVERIEWILSDHPDAVAFREENRKNLAICNGTFNAETWVSSIQPGKTADDRKRPPIESDEQLAQFFSSLGD